MNYSFSRSWSRRLAPGCVKLFALLVSQVLLHAGPTKGAGHVGFPIVTLPEVSRGHEAIQRLGAQLPDVAQAYGLRPDELQNLLKEDSSLAVDRAGRLHFTDPAPAAGTLVAEAAVPEAALVPLTETFKLHSRPGAKRILFLDFDGHLISGTGWNTSYNGGRDIIAPPWDIDGSPGTFGDVERTRIQQIWQRVAEDYAPFDVDVTTELTSESQITRSSSADEYYGTRVLISPISSYVGNYGGVAYIGVYDDVGDAYKPALVFPENLANGEKYIAEAVSHEAGHNLGLNHDGTASAGYYEGQGTGTAGWAPIMGAGYYKNLTQWSKGEYSGANNKQDDLAVMQTYGLPARADDHGGTAATASHFPAGTQLSASGVIERSTDVDVFAFTTGAGVISIQVFGSELGPNLDILAELRDANGVLLGANNFPELLGATLEYSVTAGTYFLHVRSTGLGDPLTTGYTSYGSLGQYWIGGSVVNPTGSLTPVANASATPSVGTAPLVVQFDGSSSFDQDGTIVSYNWNFGDGTTGTGVTASHTYGAGSYTATLTVTDNTGLTSTTSISIQAQPPTATTVMFVQSIALAVLRQPSGDSLRATVKIVDTAGNPVSGATVSGSFNSVVSGTATATTDANGHAVLTSRRSKKNGTVTFTVTNVSRTGAVYNAANNLQTSATTAL